MESDTIWDHHHHHRHHHSISVSLLEKFVSSSCKTKTIKFLSLLLCTCNFFLKSGFGYQINKYLTPWTSSPYSSFSQRCLVVVSKLYIWPSNQGYQKALLISLFKEFKVMTSSLSSSHWHHQVIPKTQFSTAL